MVGMVFFATINPTVTHDIEKTIHEKKMMYWLGNSVLYENLLTLQQDGLFSMPLQEIIFSGKFPDRWIEKRRRDKLPPRSPNVAH